MPRPAFLTTRFFLIKLPKTNGLRGREQMSGGWWREQERQMANTPGTNGPATETGLPAQHVYVAASFCLLIGLFTGYFFLGRGSHAMAPAARNATRARSTHNGEHPPPTLEQMKQMADLQASALVEKSKAEPKNAGLLIQIAAIYQGAHQFKEAASYFNRALEIESKNVSARTELASCLYYSGDADGALSQLNEALKYNPKDTNALFNLGMIKYRGKNDPAGAVTVWQKLLKTNPNLERRPLVEQLIAEAKVAKP
jgi:cytochrome c-type biogenesis protein CcmH/NrfG